MEDVGTLQINTLLDTYFASSAKRGTLAIDFLTILVGFDFVLIFLENGFCVRKFERTNTTRNIRAKKAREAEIISNLCPKYLIFFLAVFYRAESQ